jgi:DNA polymerase III alpha subunit (gram-positive type)
MHGSCVSIDLQACYSTNYQLDIHDTSWTLFGYPYTFIHSTIDTLSAPRLYILQNVFKKGGEVSSPCSGAALDDS